MAKLEIPTAQYEVELVAGNPQAAMKAAEAVKGEVWKVPFANIRRLPDFNVRINTPDYEAHKEELAQSILANGYYEDKPLAGYVAKEDGENVIYLTDGYTRLAAAEIARERGAELPTLPVIVKPKSDSLVELTVALVQANEGRPLGPFEKAIVVQRLLGYGVERDEVARRLSMTTRNVLNLETLAGASPKIRNSVIKGEISPTEAVKIISKTGGKAAKVVDAAVAAAKAAGKKKATGKHVKQAIKEAAGDEGGASSTTTTFELNLTAGQKIETDKLTPVLYALGGEWWREPEELDEAKEGEVVITETISFSLTITRYVTQEDGEADASDASDEGGDGEADASDEGGDDENGGL